MEEEPKVVGEIRSIRVDKIRPNPNQGRKYFDHQKLVQLAKSIKKEGQEVPIEVRKMPDGFYEIIKGERRWRAHKIIGLEFIDAIIKEGISDKQAKRKSTIDNHGREGHTILESMNMIAEDLLEMKNDKDRPPENKTMEVMIQEIADSYGQKTNWVYRHLRLWNLHKDILKLLNPRLPENERINFSTALAIAKCPDKLRQLEMANKAVKERMTASQVEHNFRIIAQKNGVAYGQRKRLPSDDREVFEGFLNRTLHHVTRYFDAFHSDNTIKRMFDKSGDKKQAKKICARCSELFKEIADSL